MRNKTGYTYWVCVDCYFTHHGSAEETQVEDPLSLIPDDVEVTAGLLKDEHSCDYDAGDWETCECEQQDFSWSRCDGCGTTLGGTRHALTVWFLDRNYDEINRMVEVIQEAIEHGFTYTYGEAYEFFASEGDLGDPADLSDTEFREKHQEVLELAQHASLYLNDRDDQKARA